MKTLKNISIIVAVFISLSSTAKEKISLFDAVAKKYVTAKITGTGYTSGSSSHYGECMKIELGNLSYISLEILLETGRKLIPVNDSVQTMIITKEMMITLLPKETKTIFEFAMCIEKPDLPPSPKRKFNVGEMAGGKLLQLTKLIEKHNYQDNTGQQAVWVVSNSLPVSSVSSYDSAKVKVLRSFFTGETVSNTYFINSSGATIHGKFTWNMDKQGTVSIVVLNDSGFEIGEILCKKKYDKGSQTYNFQYTGCLIEPNKVYKVRLKIQDYTIEELACISEEIQ